MFVVVFRCFHHSGKQVAIELTLQLKSGAPSLIYMDVKGQGEQGRLTRRISPGKYRKTIMN